MAFKIEDLNDDDRVLVASYTYRLFADLKEIVRKGAVLDHTNLQTLENSIVTEITSVFVDRAEQIQSRPEEKKQ